MLRLNLVNSENSDIKYKISRFPDGQQSITLDMVDADLLEKITVGITSRFNSFRDLEIIIAANQALREFSYVENVKLNVPYFLGARSDRKFESGTSNYLRTVICPIINAQKFSRVTILDPHSDVLEACLNNYHKHNNHRLVKDALTKIDNKDGAQDRICLVSPDAGAYKKIFDVAKEFKIDRIVTASKVRDIKTGKILRTEIPTLDQHADLKYVIIDDICDGGRTFIELAKAIKESRPSAKVYLIVTHGIFSAGFKELSQYFEAIYTTNSYRDVADNEYEEETRTTTFNIF
ncbi:PrsA Phosphoribosylpyrophosphate synthetase [uncultured Caudovirales phage]|uniref:PrsA Phosphoribosylpyrophosphate synthetase n=1 Tax=uncultured Caudovirales phage TaxID=2100421 RepID=A0A6J5KXC9_9CAUD|nr:PrsA Phosphoribosylpyrophosphate synthetase [uncultured Caudovirales phage]